MPSKKRGGLSKPEYARAQAAKAMPKVTAKPKAVAPLAGAGPLLPGQTRQANSYGGGSQLQGAGPLLPGQTRAKDSYKGGQSNDVASRRREAAKAANIKNAGFDLTSAVNSGGLSVNEFSKPVAQRQATLGQGSSTFMGNLKNRAIGGFMDLMGGFGKNLEANSLARDLGGLEITDEQRKANRQAAYDNSIGIPTTNAQTPFDLPMNNDQYQQDLASVFGPQPKQPDFNEALQSGGITENIPQDTGRGRLAELFAPTASAQEDPYRGNGRGNNTNFDNTEEVSGIDPTLQTEMMMSPADAPLVDNPGPTVGNRSGRGSGMFATGKGLMSDDPYIKELRKAYSSNGGEKWLRKQFDELIKALDPTYAQMQKEGTDALNAQLNNQNVQLASVMNANNTGDSEQRAQLMAGQQRDTQTALGNLLAKLAQAKAQDASGLKQQYATQRGQLEERKQSNQQRLLEAIRSYQNDQYDQRYKNASLAGRGGGKETAGDAPAIREIMNGLGVDAATAQAIWKKENGITSSQDELLGALLGGR